eukprot:gene12117-biopygen18453
MGDTSYTLDRDLTGLQGMEGTVVFLDRDGDIVLTIHDHSLTLAAREQRVRARNTDKLQLLLRPAGFPGEALRTQNQC